MEQRPAKRAQRANPDASPEVLRNRWRELEAGAQMGTEDLKRKQQRDTVNPCYSMAKHKFQSKGTEREKGSNESREAHETQVM